MNPSSQRTTVIASSVLASLAVIQLAVVFTILVKRASLIGNGAPQLPVVAAVPSPVPSTASAKSTPAATRDPLNGGLMITTSTASATSIPAATAAPPIAEAKPESSVVPVTEEKTASAVAEKPVQARTSAPLSEKEQILLKARRARDNGDMTAALAGFRQAQRVVPDDPTVVSELATTYEAMGLTDKAMTQWRRVMAAGEKAGDLYGIAAEKLRTGVATPDASMSRDTDGLQPGSTLGLVDTQKIYEENPDGTAKVTVRVAVKSRPTSEVVAGDVSVQVMFYELVNNHEVEETNSSAAKVTSEWITSPPDWRGDNMEVLRVIYEQRSARPADPDAIDPEQRKYLGYIAKVYYKNELQDVRADPVKLLQFFPPKVTLTSTSEIPQ